MHTHQSPPPSSIPKYLQENDLTQECRDVISSLPTEEDWVGSNHLHLFQGFWIISTCMAGVLAFQKYFQARDTDIILATTPKAGTTWLKAILFSLLNRVHYPDLLKHPLLTSNPHVLVPFLETDLYIENQVPDLTSFVYPRLFSTHLSYNSLPTSAKASNCKIVYLCRNPKDTFVSLWHFTNKLKLRGTNSLEEAFDKFCRGVSLYGPYWDHVLSFWKESIENPQNILFLKYEKMKEQPTYELRKVAEFLGCPFTPEEEAKGVVNDILSLCSFDNLSTLEVNKSGKLSSGHPNEAFFRLGKVGDYTNYLTAEMVEKLDRITEENFRETQLKF
ncbi:hypothetical protein I3842_05G118800 [Carya illinoinensis]|uniref:Sulfotransferase n=1 Tax=Carya illinoinensis TaxID=32201 RepID=A0A922EZ10_CARIL|nr:hypothetical protein I3842_05G118800 [Carya illinoinensis]